MGRLIQDIKDLINILNDLLKLALLIGLAVGGWFLFTFVFFPEIPKGPEFDCDDSTLAMYHHFKQMGFEVTLIAGNLKMEKEKFPEECDHVWLIVKMGNRNIAYDWGKPWADPQHYEGYPITYEELIKAVEADID